MPAWLDLQACSCRHCLGIWVYVRIGGRSVSLHVGDCRGCRDPYRRPGVPVRVVHL